MIAIEISSFGAPEVLKPVERPRPIPGAGEVLLKVEAAGVARADIIQRQGHYPPPAGAPDIPGLDAAGIVEAIGPGVERWAPGQQVCAILAGGGYAEYVAVPEPQVLPIPEGWDASEAATLPENLLTVYDNVVTRAGLQAGETILIHGGSSGIGSMGIMLSRTLQATVLTTAGTPDKCAACLELGADCAIDYRQSDFVTEVLKATNGRGADVVLDMVGGAYLDRNLDCLALEGRIVFIATQGGRTGTLDIGKLMMKRGRVMGSTMRARTPDQKGAVARAAERNVWPLLLPKSTIRPVIDTIFPLAEAAQAHRRMESGSHVGKIVLVTGFGQAARRTASTDGRAVR